MPSQKPRGANRAIRAFAAVAGLVAVVAVTAAITYSVARQPSAGTAATGSAIATTPTASVEQQAAAKNRICELFDAGTKGLAGKGGVRVEGQLNIPVVLRMTNSAAAVNSALTPAVPVEVAQAAREYVARVFDLTTEATGEGNIETLGRRNDDAIKAIDSFLGVCGLPR